jgi:hypothetical protein
VRSDGDATGRLVPRLRAAVGEHSGPSAVSGSGVLQMSRLVWFVIVVLFYWQYLEAARYALDKASGG